jgi:hypothetical protein
VRLVSWKRRNILKATWTTREDVVKRLPRTLTSPLDGHRTVLTFIRCGGMLFSIRQGSKNLALPLFDIDRLDRQITLSARSGIMLRRSERVRRTMG